jgi:hypothetical protein
LATASAIQGRPSYDEDLTPAEQQGQTSMSGPIQPYRCQYKPMKMSDWAR